MQTDLPSWDWVPATFEAQTDRRGVLVHHLGQALEIFDAWPEIHVFTETPVMHISGWRSMVGGVAQVAPDEEEGFKAGFAEADFDDSSWYRTSRINEVTFCFPTWEGDSYDGYLWYRAEVLIGDLSPNRLLLGSLGERRTLGWRVFVNGAEITSGQAQTSVLDIAIPEWARPASGSTAIVAVQLRVGSPLLDADRVREREGWRRVDLQCLQLLSVDDPWRQLPLSPDRHTEGVVALTAESVSVKARYDTSHGVIRKSVTVQNDGCHPVAIARVDLASGFHGGSA